MEIKIKNTFDKKLKKDFQVIIPYQLVEGRVNDHIAKIKNKISLKGFRKGQVPPSIIKEKYGQSIMADESDKIISDTIHKIVKDNNLKLALSPKINIVAFEANKDVEFTTSIEIYPQIPEIDLERIKLTKREIEISAEDTGEALNKLLKLYRKWNKQDKPYKAKIGDSVVIDYLGKIDKNEFKGGASKEYRLELGSKSFIDDFEEQLVGKRAGDECLVKVKFPKDYHNSEFAGKAAEFDVKIHEVLTGEMPQLTDEFIKDNFGLDSQEKFLDALKRRLEQDYEEISNSLFKKELFDFLNKKYDFDLPTGLVEQQFSKLWAEVEEELKNNPAKFKSEREKEKAKEKKRNLAERMIRCDMILSDIAQKNKIETNNDDLNQELRKILARFPGQEKIVTDFYQQNQGALQQLKGSVIEQKTVKFISASQSIEKKKTSTKDLDKMWQKANEE